MTLVMTYLIAAPATGFSNVCKWDIISQYCFCGTIPTETGKSTKSYQRKGLSMDEHVWTKIAKNLSDTSLNELHDCIKKCLKSDDEGISSEHYGVRKYRDWRKQADIFEAELRERGNEFEPIDW